MKAPLTRILQSFVEEERHFLTQSHIARTKSIQMLQLPDKQGAILTPKGWKIKAKLNQLFEYLMTEPPLLCTKMCEVILCCASSPNLCLYAQLTVSGSSWCLAAIPPFVSWHRPAWKSSSSASGHWCWLSATDSEACPPPQKHHCNLPGQERRLQPPPCWAPGSSLGEWTMGEKPPLPHYRTVFMSRLSSQDVQVQMHKKGVSIHIYSSHTEYFLS